METDKVTQSNLYWLGRGGESDICIHSVWAGRRTYYYLNLLQGKGKKEPLPVTIAGNE
jgi:hypothetical protein